MSDRKNRDTKGFSLQKIKPLTETQKDVFASYYEGYNLFLHGSAGTGKTFLSLYLALNDLEKRTFGIDKVYIIRSVVPTRDMGFLPGNQKEKMRVYEAPYYSICNELYGRGDAYDILKQKNLVEFMSTSFIRGITLNNCVIIVDEAQNMDAMELHSIMTRVGENCKIIFCGDYKQDDLSSERKKEQSGIRSFMTIVEEMDEFECIEFDCEDIVRSGLVKSYIITREKLGM